MKKYLLILFTSLILSCSSSLTTQNKVDLITIKKIDCWLNLMPGGPPTFHYSGEIEIRKIKPEKFSFDQIEFLDNHTILNKSFPVYDLDNDKNIEKNESFTLHFYSPQGIKVTEDMLKSEYADSKLIFKLCDEIIEIIQTDIKILKTY